MHNYIPIKAHNNIMYNLPTFYFLNDLTNSGVKHLGSGREVLGPMSQRTQIETESGLIPAPTGFKGNQVLIPNNDLRVTNDLKKAAALQSWTEFSWLYNNGHFSNVTDIMR